ncbi:MAG: gliding motility-associated C-terminal domain-containing protein, partial [Cyclobacteriaceae bacterium]|nr:gliding motility-associated C-terminal domain-containing protein [Cyclobacteriaceae bacterium]
RIEGTSPADAVDESDSETVFANQSPSIALTLSADPDECLVEGDVVTFTATLLNDGNVTLTDISLSDATGLDVFAETIATLEVDDSEVFTFEYTITEADVLAGVISNEVVGAGIFVSAQSGDINYSDLATATITLAPVIEASITSSFPLGTDVSCAGAEDGSVEVSVVGGTAPYTFSWRDAEDNELGTDFELDNLGAGTYTIIVTDANGCEVTDTITLEDADEFTTEITNTVTEVCEDGSITLTALPEGGDFTIIEGESFASINGDQLSFTGFGEVIVRYTVENENGCIAIDEQTINVQQLPAISFPDFPTIYCEADGAIDLSEFALPAGGQWFGDGVAADSITFDPEVAGVGTHVLTYTFTNGICEVSETISIQVAPVVTQPVFRDGDLLEICSPTMDINQDIPVDVDVTGSLTFILADFVVVNGEQPFLNDAGNSIVTIPEGFVGSFRMLVVNEGCGDDQGEFIQVNVDPVFTFSLEAIDEPELCSLADDEVRIAINSGYDLGEEVSLMIGMLEDPEFSLSVRSTSFPATFAVDTLGTFFITEISENICSQIDFDNNSIEVIDIPFEFSPGNINWTEIDDFYCEGEEITLSVDVAEADMDQLTFIWRIPGQGEIGRGTDLVVGADVLSNLSGSFQIRLDVTDGCKLISLAQDTEIRRLPTVSILFNPSRPIVFERTSLRSETEGDEYFWYVDSVFVGEGRDLVYEFEEAGDFLVGLEIIRDGCSNYGERMINVISTNIVYVPNVFNPSAESSENQVAKVYGERITNEDFSFTIFDRWGNVVYRTRDRDEAMEQGWNGLDNNRGRQLPNGAYSYILTGQFEDGEIIQERGKITLLR